MISRFSLNYFRRILSGNLQIHRSFAVIQKRAPPISKLAIPGVKNLLLVSSTKGGVGKSTVAVNLALALKTELKNEPIGLLDADVFGPSIPKMLSLEGLKPEADEKKRIIPLKNYDLKCMSIGFLIDTTSPVVWRGLMVMSAIQQLLHQVAWGPLHTLVIDMPPGTGDVQLSICQSTFVHGAIIVTTPQAVATADSHRGIAMLRKLDVPIFGIVENMSEYICPSCGHRELLFSSSDDGHSNSLSGGAKLANDTNLSILSRIPIDPRLVRAGDCGKPLVISYPDSEVAKIYYELAKLTLKHMSQKKI